jgi:hypothetical protein
MRDGEERESEREKWSRVSLMSQSYFFLKSVAFRVDFCLSLQKKKKERKQFMKIKNRRRRRWRRREMIIAMIKM